jgi:hypothetical protein
MTHFLVVAKGQASLEWDEYEFKILVQIEIHAKLLISINITNIGIFSLHSAWNFTNNRDEIRPIRMVREARDWLGWG